MHNVATGFWANRTSSPLFQICSYSLDYTRLATAKEKQWNPMFTSPSIPYTLTPSWDMVQVKCHELCRCDLDRPILIRVLDQPQTTALVSALSSAGTTEDNDNQNENQDSDLENLTSMGSFETTVRELLKRHSGRFTLLSEDGNSVGRIVVVMVLLEIPASSTSNVISPVGNAAESAATKNSTKKNLLGPINDQEEEEDSDSDDEEEEEIENSAEFKAAKILVTEINLFSQPTATSKAADNHKDIKEDTESDIEDSSSEEETEEEEEEKEPKPKSTTTLHLTLRGMDLTTVPGGRSLDGGVTSSRYVKIATFCPGEDTMFQDVFTSEPVLNDLNSPTWGPLELNLDDLCRRQHDGGGGNHNLDWPINNSVWEETTLTASSTTAPRRGTPYGSCQTTVSELLKNQIGQAGDVAHSSKSGKVMTLEQRGRTWGKLACAQATMVTPENEDENDDETKNTTPPVVTAAAAAPMVPAWLSRTRNLVAELVEYATNATSNISQVDGAVTTTTDDNSNNNQQMDKESSLHTIAELLAAVQDDSDSDDDSDDSDDDDDITIADILSVAEASLLSGKLSDQASQVGMLEIVDLLKPKHARHRLTKAEEAMLRKTEQQLSNVTQEEEEQQQQQQQQQQRQEEKQEQQQQQEEEEEEKCRNTQQSPKWERISPLDNERELLLGKRSCYIPNAGHECLSDGKASITSKV